MGLFELLKFTSQCGLREKLAQDWLIEFFFADWHT